MSTVSEGAGRYLLDTAMSMESEGENPVLPVAAGNAEGGLLPCPRHEYYLLESLHEI